MIVVAAVAVAGLGCRPLYVARLGIEHLRYIGRARPIEEVLAETADEERRAKLELVLAARTFAAEQGLNVGGSYLKVSDTEGLATAYVVTAAYRDRLEPVVWRYPIIGRIPYRGYLDRRSAERYAAKLEAQGFDTHIVEAAGYSTLGWFDDPLPSGSLRLDEVELVTVVLHELVHQTVYVPGNISFNETLASAAAYRLAERFFSSRGDRGQAEQVRRRHRRWLEQSRVLERWATELNRYFEETRGRDPAARREGRRAVYRRMWPDLLDVELVRPDSKREEQLLDRFNNAVFLALYRYRKHADAFERFLDGYPTLRAALEAIGAREDTGEDPFDWLQRTVDVALGPTL